MAFRSARAPAGMLKLRPPELSISGAVVITPRAEARPLRFRLTRLLRAGAPALETLCLSKPLVAAQRSGGAEDAKPRWTLPEASARSDCACHDKRKPHSFLPP